MRAIREKYNEAESSTEIDWYCDLGEIDVDIDLVNQPIGTGGEDERMAEMMLNMMMAFADAERR